MNENINLVEILRDCPAGTKLYSELHGEVVFKYTTEDHMFPILVDYSDVDGNTRKTCFTKDGKFLYSANGECVLFPSKEQRDWNKFECPKRKFNPGTLKPLDKILVQDSSLLYWCTIFSHYKPYDEFPIKTIFSVFKYCIPYNDETKYLVGTREKAPEYYRYWEE